MKKILFSILSAFMVSTMASAQYLNVKLDDGTYRSFKTSSKTEVSFGDKKGTEPTEFEQTVTVNGYKVTVKLADGTPASEVMVCAYIEGEDVKVGAFPRLNYGLECIGDNSEALTHVMSNGYYTYTLSSLSDISKDVVVTVGYITVSFDLNITDNFKAKPEDIRIGYNSTVPLTYASAEKHSFRGWYTDKECTKAWSYSTDKVTKSMTLYAKWAEDPTETKINDHEYVKLGGYYWATDNIGEVKDQNSNNMYIGNDTTYGYYYNQTNAIQVAKTWNKGSVGGRSWTLPSKAQWQALIDYCNWTWTTDYEYNGTTMNGMLVTGRDDTFESGHSIFLPAAGLYYGGAKDASDKGLCGYYWSTYKEWLLDFNSVDRYLIDYEKGIGMAVRPVSE